VAAINSLKFEPASTAGFNVLMLSQASKPITTDTATAAANKVVLLIRITSLRLIAVKDSDPRDRRDREKLPAAPLPRGIKA
jgi:hypothetical protein